MQYTYEISELTIPFLDISTRVVGDCIATSVYTKPTDTHCYLQYDSSHPIKCKDSIPFSQILRLRRICSDGDDYRNKAKQMCQYFHERGYPTHVTRRALTKVSSISREECLISRVRNGKNGRVVLALDYHPLNIKVRDIINKHFNILHTDRRSGSIFDELPVTAWRRDKNLRDILVHTGDRAAAGDFGSFPCNRQRCNTCPYIVDTNHIFGPSGSMMVRGNFTCITTNVVYCITCTRCNKLYIGSTVRRLGDRFAEHLRHSRQGNHLYPVSKHFNSGDHRVSDMSISGVCIVNGSVNQLRRIEEETIATFSLA